MTAKAIAQVPVLLMVTKNGPRFYKPRFIGSNPIIGFLFCGQIARDKQKQT
jgi:hypothetical protein